MIHTAEIPFTVIFLAVTEDMFHWVKVIPINYADEKWWNSRMW